MQIESNSEVVLTGVKKPGLSSWALEVREVQQVCQVIAIPDLES